MGIPQTKSSEVILSDALCPRAVRYARVRPNATVHLEQAGAQGEVYAFMINEALDLLAPLVAADQLRQARISSYLAKVYSPPADLGLLSTGKPTEMIDPFGTMGAFLST